MKKSMVVIACAVAMICAVLVLSSPLVAQEASTEAAKKAEAEMKTTLGTVPFMMRAYPESMRAGAWEWFKSRQNPNAAIPKKYAELISLGVASQIPCAYCVYAHTTMAKMLGATEAEIQEAIAGAAETRHWSTVLNGADVSLGEFKREWDGILAHMQKQTKPEVAAKK